MTDSVNMLTTEDTTINKCQLIATVWSHLCEHIKTNETDRNQSHATR